jgi:hypothetical protein
MTERYSVWQSFKRSWPGMSFWQKCAWVVFFPVLFPFLAVIVWATNAWGINVHGRSQQDD